MQCTLQRLYVCCANIPVEASLFTIVLENHGAIVFADGDAIVRDFRFSFSRRIDRLLKPFIQSFVIIFGHGNNLHIFSGQMPLCRFFLHYLKNVTFISRNQLEEIIKFQFFRITELQEIRNIVKQCRFLIRLSVLLLQPRNRAANVTDS